MKVQDFPNNPELFENLQPGDHFCCIYESESEHRAVITPYIRQGLENEEKVIYIVDAHTADAVLATLREEGLDVQHYQDSGQLVISTRKDTYLREGSFDPDKMITFLRATMERALAEGYRALRVTGEMTWAIHGLPGSERLIEYEAKLNHFFPGNPCTAVCQYDRRQFDPAILLDVIHTHPIVIIGGQIYNNFYFVPPDTFLNNRPAARLQQWIQSLQDSKNAQDELRKTASFLKQTQAITQVGGWEYNALTQKVSWTDEVYRIYEVDRDYNPSDIHQAVSFYASHDQAKIDRAFQRAVEFGEPYDLELEFISSSGKTKWVRTSGQAEQKNGRVMRVFGNILDVTKNRQARDALRTSEERFHIAQEMSLDAFTILAAIRDLNGKIVDFEWTYVNASAGKILKHDPEELLGKRLLQILPGNLENHALFERYVQIVEGGQGNEVELEYNADGISGWFRNMSIKLEDGVAVSFSDITSRKRIEAAEREQRALAEALGDTAAALNSTLRFDHVLDRILDNVGRVISHDADAVLILLIDEASDTAQIVRYGSPRNPDYAARMAKLKLPVTKTRSLREMRATGGPIMIADTRTYTGWNATTYNSWIRSNLGVPIKSKGKVIGFLNLASATPNAFTAQDVDRLRTFADQAAIAIENAQLYEEVQELAITDALTSVLNRRGLFQIGEREVERAIRFQHSLAVIMLDIDHFKQVNDTFGHPNGDRVLRALAENCCAQVRNVDIVARYGGEEFTLLLPETDLASATQVAERLRESVENMAIAIETEDESDKAIKITISQGVVMLSPEMLNLSALIARADRALYAAKQAGRNRVAREE